MAASIAQTSDNAIGRTLRKGAQASPRKAMGDPAGRQRRLCGRHGRYAGGLSEGARSGVPLANSMAPTARATFRAVLSLFKCYNDKALIKKGNGQRGPFQSHVGWERTTVNQAGVVTLAVRALRRPGDWWPRYSGSGSKRRRQYTRRFREPRRSLGRAAANVNAKGVRTRTDLNQRREFRGLGFDRGGFWKRPAVNSNLHSKSRVRFSQRDRDGFRHIL
jgi:hypothetical protein